MEYKEKLVKALQNTSNLEALDESVLGNLRFITVKARVEQVETADLSEVEQARLQKASEVFEARSPVTEDGKPVMMKLSAWIAHEGPANANGDAFLGEDLEAVVANGLFAPPHVGMVDFNHDFFPYGVWFSSSYEMDPQAGYNGILAEGTLFAWRFPEMADKLLAEQARNGFVAVSMACVAKHIETRYNADTQRTEEVLREPTFLTASFLDVSPADKDGRGAVSEDEGSTHESRVEELNEALLSLFAARAEESASATNQEDEMDLEKIIEALKEAMGEAAGEHVSEIKEALQDAAAVPGLREEVATLTAKLSEAETQLETVQAELDSKATALDAKIAELAEAVEQLEAVTAERDSLLEEKEALTMAALREERLEQLPEAYRKALDGRDEEVRERVIARLLDLSDEDFTEELKLIAESLPGKTSMAEQSRDEGRLPSFTGSGSGEFKIDKYSNR